MTAVVMNTSGVFSQTPQIQQTTGGKEERKADFEGLMLGKIGNSAQTDNNVIAGGNTNKKTASAEISSNNTSSGKNETVKASDGEKKDAAAVNQKHDSSVHDVTDAGKDNEKNLNSEEAAAALEAIGTIIQGIAEILNVSPEQLQEAMDEISMQPGDLTDRNSLAQLVLTLNNTNDLSELLVDNGMLEQLNAAAGFVEAALEESGIDAEKFSSMVNSEGFADMAGELLQEDNLKTGLNDIIKKFFPESDEAEIIPEDSEGNRLQNITDNGPQITVVKQDGEGADTENDSEGSGEETVPEKGVSDKAERTETGRTSAGQFVQNLEKAADNVNGVNGQTIDVRDVVYQVVRQIRVNISPENTSLEMRLNPDNLGRVAINITSRNGVMTAEIHTENQAAREAIESQLQILKENIQERGLKVEAIEVRVSDFNFNDSADSQSDAYQEDGNSGRRSRKNGSAGLSVTGEITEAAKTARELLDNAGSTVSYRV